MVITHFSRSPSTPPILFLTLNLILNYIQFFTTCDWVFRSDNPVIPDGKFLDPNEQGSFWINSTISRQLILLNYSASTKPIWFSIPLSPIIMTIAWDGYRPRVKHIIPIGSHRRKKWPPTHLKVLCNGSMSSWWQWYVLVGDDDDLILGISFLHFFWPSCGQARYEGHVR